MVTLLIQFIMTLLKKNVKIMDLVIICRIIHQIHTGIVIDLKIMILKFMQEIITMIHLI